MGENTAGEFEQLIINNDDVIQGYQINEKIDEGAYGQVFKVSKEGKKYAMKVEPKRLDGGKAALLVETDVLTSLQSKDPKFFPKFVYSGMDGKCHVLVMELLGENLKMLRLRSTDPNSSSPGTWTRIGIQCLYVLKQMHDCGFIHHDIKPGNFAMGSSEKLLHSRVLHLLDFGISRAFIRRRKRMSVAPNTVDGEYRLEKKKVNSLKGTPIYCSPRAHSLSDTGRVDDIWSLLYMIAEMVAPLPWSFLEDKELEKVKLNCKLKDLFKDEAFEAVEQMLRNSSFYSFPNYELIYKALKSAYDRSGSSWMDPYDWETERLSSFVKWKQDAEKRTTLFPWEYADVSNFFRQDPWMHVQDPRKKEKKEIGESGTVTAEAPTLEEAKTPKPVTRKKLTTSTKPVKTVKAKPKKGGK